MSDALEKWAEKGAKPSHPFGGDQPHQLTSLIYTGIKDGPQAISRTSSFTILGHSPAEPIPGLASPGARRLTPSDRLSIERDMNGVLERLNALLATGGAHA